MTPTSSDKRHPATSMWDPPGPGFWELETTHHGLRPLSHVIRTAYVRGFEAGATTMIARYGLPLARLRGALVEGCFYIRAEGIGEGSKPKPPPPLPIMKAIARLHPEMRRRTRTARQAWAERRWRTEVDQWFNHDRAVMQARNLDLQAVDVAAIDDPALAAHISDCLAHFEDGLRRNLDTHGGDLMPVGDYLAHCEVWGIDSVTASAMLVGYSPATIETATLLRPVVAALAALDPAEPAPDSIDGVRALGPEVRSAIDTWLEHHAWRLITSDDIDRPTLAELPALQLRALLAAARPEVDVPDPTQVRIRVPAQDRTTFDALLEEARYGNRQREDIRGLCMCWPGGILRRSLLEAGHRLVARGALHDAAHVAECTPDELAGLLRNGRGPGPSTFAERAAARNRIEATPPPRSLGEPEPPPPLAALPPAMARATTALMSNLSADQTAHHAERLHGTGIGHTTYQGRARVVRDVADALDRLEQGDVLVAAFTGPSFNSIVPMLGALIVEEGGPQCHAAIVAREFGLPALVGTNAAMSDIPDGALIEVDPGAGLVRVLSPSRGGGQLTETTAH